MDILYYFNAKLNSASMASQCIQLNFGGGEVVSPWQVVPCLNLKNRGGEREKWHLPSDEKWTHKLLSELSTHKKNKLRIAASLFDLCSDMSLHVLFHPRANASFPLSPTLFFKHRYDTSC